MTCVRLQRSKIKSESIQSNKRTQTEDEKKAIVSLTIDWVRWEAQTGYGRIVCNKSIVFVPVYLLCRSNHFKVFSSVDRNQPLSATIGCTNAWIEQVFEHNNWPPTPHRATPTKQTGRGRERNSCPSETTKQELCCAQYSRQLTMIMEDNDR